MCQERPTRGHVPEQCLWSRPGEAAAGGRLVSCLRSHSLSESELRFESKPSRQPTLELSGTPRLPRPQANELPNLVQIPSRRVHFSEMQFSSRHFPPHMLSVAPLSWRSFWMAGVTDDLRHRSSPRRGRLGEEGGRWMGCACPPALSGRVNSTSQLSRFLGCVDWGAEAPGWVLIGWTQTISASCPREPNQHKVPEPGAGGGAEA